MIFRAPIRLECAALACSGVMVHETNLSQLAQTNWSSSRPISPVLSSRWFVGNDPYNHPSGDPLPSAADFQRMRQLREASAAVDIPLLDHVIIGRRKADPLGRGYYSFREAGLL